MIPLVEQYKQKSSLPGVEPGRIELIGMLDGFLVKDEKAAAESKGFFNDSSFYTPC